MNSSTYSEDTLVQQTTADYLERQLGWKTVFAYNSAGSGPASFMGDSAARRLYE